VYDKEISMQCDFKSGSPFEFDGNSPLLKENELCNIENPMGYMVILKWKTQEFSISDSKFERTCN